MKTTKDIANETGRLHKNITRMVRAAIRDINGFEFEESYYISSQNKKIKMYKLPDCSYSFILDKCRGLNRENRIRQNAALDAIEQVLGITLEREYSVGPYRIDGYHIGSNTAYEIDECNHFDGNGLVKACQDRQAYISESIGCEFKRIKV